MSTVTVPAAATLLKPPKNAFEVTFPLASRNTTLLAPEDAVTPVPPEPTASVPASVIVPLVVIGPPDVVRPVEPPATLTLVTVPVLDDAAKVPPAESVKPEPTVTALGDADAVPGFPSKELPAIDARIMVPDVVIGPPESPVPVLMLVTVPEPVEIEIVPPKETGVLLIVIALLARALLGMAVKPVPIAPTVNVPTPVMPV